MLCQAYLVCGSRGSCSGATHFQPVWKLDPSSKSLRTSRKPSALHLAAE